MCPAHILYSYAIQRGNQSQSERPGPVYWEGWTAQPIRGHRHQTAGHLLQLQPGTTEAAWLHGTYFCVRVSTSILCISIPAFGSSWWPLWEQHPSLRSSYLPQNKNIYLLERLRSADLLRASRHWWTKAVPLLHQPYQRPIRPACKKPSVYFCRNMLMFVQVNDCVYARAHMHALRRSCLMLLELKVRWGRSDGYFCLVRPEFTWTQ